MNRQLPQYGQRKAAHQFGERWMATPASLLNTPLVIHPYLSPDSESLMKIHICHQLPLTGWEIKTMQGDVVGARPATKKNLACQHSQTTSCPESNTVSHPPLNGSIGIDFKVIHQSTLNVVSPINKCSVTTAGFNSRVTVHMPRLPETNENQQGKSKAPVRVLKIRLVFFSQARILVIIRTP